MTSDLEATKQRILNEIRRTAEVNGGLPLGIGQFEQETAIKKYDWCGKIRARWGNAPQEAGFQPNQLQTAYDDELLIEKLISLARELGHFPVKTEIWMKARSDARFPWYNAFTRFGSKQQFARKI